MHEFTEKIALYPRHLRTSHTRILWGLICVFELGRKLAKQYAELSLLKTRWLHFLRQNKFDG